jgi:hypothetical protein
MFLLLLQYTRVTAFLRQKFNLESAPDLDLPHNTDQVSVPICHFKWALFKNITS